MTPQVFHVISRDHDGIACTHCCDNIITIDDIAGTQRRAHPSWIIVFKNMRGNRLAILAIDRHCAPQYTHRITTTTQDTGDCHSHNKGTSPLPSSVKFVLSNMSDRSHCTRLLRTRYEYVFMFTYHYIVRVSLHSKVKGASRLPTFVFATPSFTFVVVVLFSTSLSISSRNSDPGSQIRLLPPSPLRCVPSTSIARRVQHFLPSSRVELNLHTHAILNLISAFDKMSYFSPNYLPPW